DTAIDGCAASSSSATPHRLRSCRRDPARSGSSRSSRSGLHFSEWELRRPIGAPSHSSEHLPARVALEVHLAEIWGEPDASQCPGFTRWDVPPEEAPHAIDQPLAPFHESTSSMVGCASRRRLAPVQLSHCLMICCSSSSAY